MIITIAGTKHKAILTTAGLILIEVPPGEDPTAFQHEMEEAGMLQCQVTQMGSKQYIRFALPQTAVQKLVQKMKGLVGIQPQEAAFIMEAMASTIQAGPVGSEEFHTKCLKCGHEGLTKWGELPPNVKYMNPGFKCSCGGEVEVTQDLPDMPNEGYESDEDF